MATKNPHGKPFKLRFVRAAQMLLFSSALCDPPLGQATVVPFNDQTIKFTILLESSRSFPEQKWEAVLWHNGHENQEWKESVLQETTSPRQPLVIQNDSRPSVYRRWFNINLPKPSRPEPLYFTLKYRLSSSDTWKWVNEHSDCKDGVLYFQTEAPPEGLVNYLKDYSQDFSVTQVQSETPNTQLWSLTSSVKAAEDQVLTVFKPDDRGNVIAHSRNDSTQEGQVRVLAAVGATFNTALAAVMYHARKIVQGNDLMSKADKEEMQHALEKEVKAEWIENWYDGLTYCTWNGLGQDLNEQKIFDALNVLKDNKIQITNLIIDDNWQSLDNQGESQFQRGWTDFDANKEGFPNGMKHTTKEIRDQHPNIQHIAVWHALLGYWGGISPDGNIAKNYKTRKVRKAEGLAGGEMTVVHEDDVPRMYDDFYKFLLGAGIDSVKTDAQFFLDIIDDADDRRRFMKTYQDAWTIASLRYFSIKAISCMSQTPQILFHTQLTTNKPRLLVRNSDDFFPSIPSSHPFHIFTNALTSLLTSHLNVLPDWDMFQTSHPYSSFHAAARCVSGGPIYITDTPGQHSLDLIDSMTAPTISMPSKTIILRPNAVAKCIEQNVYTPYHSPRFLQLGTYHTGSTADYGTSILGIFNVSEQARTELVPLSNFPGVVNNQPEEEQKKYIIRAHPSGEISPEMQPGNEFAMVDLALEVKG
ncbi:MAG: hypothetical protein Q9216_006045, partial [Gyalolechia sp. 2 TL-2023]